MNINGLLPRQPVPALSLPLINGNQFVLGTSPGAKFDLLVFYRGWQCPLCAKQLLELEQLADQFDARGVQLIAVSCDTEDRAKQMADKINARSIKIAYNLSPRTARQWGLYLSTHIGKSSLGIDEPALFCEPGIFIVRPDGTLYYGAVQTMPFARPQVQGLLLAIDFAIDKGYPARGDYQADV
jgi:peroxiredoxin